MSTTYISPTGAGNRSGSDWANAAVISNMDAMIKKAGPNGSVLLLADAGEYKVTTAIDIRASMADGAGVTIKGVSASGVAMEAHIEGTRPAVYAAGNAVGNELFKFQAGAANLTFENLQINNTGTAFRAAGDVKNITIQHVDADNVARFFEDYAGGSNKTATITGLTIKDVDVEGFSKGVIRLQYDSSNIRIEDVRGDSQRQDGDNFAIGVHLDGTVHNVLINRTTMENATATTTGNYWNGDGFATERGVYNVVLQDTVSRGNTDAGYDLKSSGTTLIRTVADDNSRNYRIWGDATMVDAIGLNPDKRGGALNGQAQVWIADGAKLTIKGGNFSDAGSATSVFTNEGGDLKVIGAHIVYAAGARLGLGLLDGLASVDLQTVAAVGKTSALLTLLAAAPVAATPAPAAPAAVVTPPVASQPEKFTLTSGNDKLVATAKADHFAFDQTVKNGAEAITGFGKTDVLVTSQALSDGNNDGIITFGTNKLLDLGSKSGTVQMTGVASLRALGHTEEGYVYADAAVRPVKALEGKVGVSDTLSGDKGDKAANKFFIDNALDLSLGDDRLTLFGAKDIIITTTKLSDGVVGSKISTTASGFDLHNGDHDLGGFTVTNTSGAAVGALEFDGERVVGDTHYFVYSLAGSSAGLHELGL